VHIAEIQKRMNQIGVLKRIPYLTYGVLQQKSKKERRGKE